MEYADLAFWTKKGIFIDRIVKNVAFWSKVVKKSSSFFRNLILPELVAKWFTKEKERILALRTEPATCSTVVILFD